MTSSEFSLDVVSNKNRKTMAHGESLYGRQKLIPLVEYKKGVTFYPYHDSEISMLYDPFEGTKDERKTYVNDTLLENHITKILVEQAIDLAARDKKSGGREGKAKIV